MTDALLDDLNVLAGLAAERLADIQRAGYGQTHALAAQRAQLAADRLRSFLSAPAPSPLPADADR